MNLENYNINDFLSDESFYGSIKDPMSDDGLFWKSWLADHPEKQEMSDKARKILLSVDFQDKSFSRNEITDLWSNIKEQTILANNNERVKKTRNISLRPWNFLKVAAVLLPFVIASVLFLFFREIPAESEQTSNEIIEKYNPIGQKLTVFLSDGSKVKLNGDTKISYQKPFDEHQRVIQLEGEAFFEVASNKNKPFIVKTGSLETKVLGTSFNVLAYPGDDNIIVAVRSGKVAVKDVKQKISSNQSSSILLSPTEMAVYSKVEQITEVTEFDPIRTFGWSEGTLFFHDACIGEFEKKLERWYGVDIIVQRDTPIAKGITGVFEDDPSLQEILMGTKETSEFEFEFDENGNVIIK